MGIGTAFFGTKPPESTVCPFHKAMQKVEKKYYEIKEKTGDIAREVSAFFVSSLDKPSNGNSDKTENLLTTNQLQYTLPETYGDYVTFKIKIDNLREKAQLVADIKPELIALQPTLLVDLPTTQLASKQFVAPVTNGLPLHNEAAPLTSYAMQIQASETKEFHSFDDDDPKFAPALLAKPVNSEVKIPTYETTSQPLPILTPSQILTPLPQPQLVLTPLSQSNHRTHQVPIQVARNTAGLINGYTYMEILTIPWLRKLYGHLIGILDMEPDIIVSPISSAANIKTNGVTRPKIRLAGSTTTVRRNNPNVGLIKKAARLISKIKEKESNKHLKGGCVRDHRFLALDLKKSENRLKKKLANEIDKLEQLAKRLLNTLKKLNHVKKEEAVNKLLKKFAKELEDRLKKIEKLLEKQINALNKAQQKLNHSKKEKVNDSTKYALIALLKLLRRKQIVLALLLDNKKKRKNKDMLARALKKLADLDVRINQLSEGFLSDDVESSTVKL